MNLSATMLLNTTGFAAPLAQLQTQLAGALAQLQGFSVAESAAGVAGAAAAPGIVAGAAATAGAGAAASAATAATAALTAANATSSAAAVAATGALAGLTTATGSAGARMGFTASESAILSGSLTALTGHATAAASALVALRSVASLPLATLALPGAARAARGPLPPFISGAGGGGDSGAGPAAAAGAASLGSMAGGFTRVLGPIVAVTGAIAGFTAGVLTMRGALGEAINMENAEVAFTTLLGSVDAARQRIAELREFSNVTPFEPGPIIQVSKILQAFTGDALASGEGLRLVGDSAAAIDPSRLQEVAMWMGRLFSSLQGGQPLGEPLQNLTQLGLITPQIRASLLAVQGDALSTAQIMEVLQTAFGKYTGAMERLAESLGGRLSTLRGEWANLLFAFGAPVANALKPIVDDMISLFQRLKPEAAAAGEALATGMRAIRGAFAEGRLGELAGAALKLGFAEGINFLSAALPAAFSAQLAVVTTPGYWTGMANAIGAALQGLGAVLLGAFAQPIAFLNAAIETAAQNIGFAARAAFATTPLGRLTGATPGEAPRTFEENHQAHIAEVEKYTTDLVDGAAGSAADAMAGLAEAARAGAAAFSAAMAGAADAVDTSGMREALREVIDELDSAAKAIETTAKDPIRNEDGQVGAAGGSLRAATSSATATVASDRLARIGGFIGQGGPSSEYARRTAEGVARLVTSIDNLRNDVQNLSQEPAWG